MSVNQEEGKKSIKDDVESVLTLLDKTDGKLIEEHAKCLRKVLENPHITCLLKEHDVLQRPSERGQRRDYIALCVNIMQELESHSDDTTCVELLSILKSPYFRCLIEAHDNVLHETYKTLPILPPTNTYKHEPIGPPIRIIGLTKHPDEPLGISLARHPDNCIFIQRIIHGTMVEKQGLLNIGDVIKEINGEAVDSDPDIVYKKLQSYEGSITLKVVPAYKTTRGLSQVFLRCHFKYNSLSDNLFPKNEIGVPFKEGDILQVIDQLDPDWWQAMQLNDDKVGLIPSLKFEQTRRASVTHKKVKAHNLFSRNKKKIMYKTSNSAVFDCLDMQIYEEVTKMPPMERKLVILVGAQGVGRRTLKSRLITTHPDQFATTIPDTSRERREGEETGVGYNFLTKDEMLADIASGRYFEWGESQTHLYGTKLDAIRDIINLGKTCIVDCNPPALKILKTAEFMPLIVFIEAPRVDVLNKRSEKEGVGKKLTMDDIKEIVRESSYIKDNYHHYFDLVICNDNFDNTCSKLQEHLEILTCESQWVPISWVY